MDKERARKILALRQAKAPKPFKLEDVLFKEQLDFVRDPTRFATAVCSVRAGKTVSCAADLLDTAVRMPGTTGLYIALTRSSAKRIVWPELLRLNRTYQLGLVPNIAELSLVHPVTGSTIYLGGANTEDEIEKYRGLSNVALAYCDESQAMRAHIESLVDDVIVKRLYDTNGRCRLIGTPGPIPSGYFYKAAHSPKWAHHRWTLHHNKFLEKKSGITAEQQIVQDCERMGVTVDHPAIQRECFGLWATDESALILNYKEEVNHFDVLPNRQWTYVMGIDLGFDDADAVVVLAYSDVDSTTYLVEESVVAKQDITSLVEAVQKMQAKYDVVKMVIDTGGLGKKIAEEIRKRKQIPVETADKVRKMENLALLNDAMRRGSFKAKKDSQFAADCMEFELDRAKSTPDKMKVSDRFHSDVIDAVLYSFKESPAYSWEPKQKEPVVGSKEWYLKKNQIDWEAERERLTQQESGDEGMWPAEPGWSKFER